MKIILLLKSLYAWLMNEAIPVFGYWCAEKKILKKIILLNDTCQSKASEIDGIELSKLQLFNENELNRKKTIEEKARANFFGLNISFTLLFGVTALLFGKDGIGRDFMLAHPLSVKFFLIAGFLYLLFGGMAALRAGKIHLIYMLDFNEGTDETTRKILVYKYIQQNRLANIIRSNYTDASYVSVRNGLFSFGVFCIWMLANI